MNFKLPNVSTAPAEKDLAIQDNLSYKTRQLVYTSIKGRPVAQKPKSVTNAELAVMKALWERETATARDIREKLYRGKSPSDHATVQTLLNRLESKGFVKRDRSNYPHEFRAKVSREDLMGQELDSLAKKLADDSLVPIIMQAIGNTKLTAAQRDEIRALIDGNTKRKP